MKNLSDMSRKKLTGGFLKFSIFMAVVGLAAGLGLLSFVFYQVYIGDDSNLKKSTILARINEETTIYYSDESTPIGSFFEARHRRYVSIDEVPPHMINAIIAAEDKNFYRHNGVDPIAIAKAFADGVRMGSFRRGGSTITQQTVKNVMDKWERSFKRKFNEIIMALQMERLYSKRQILEFYLNQFHVASNGNGIGIAARYYFDKEVRDLSLVEAAFIAGSVKAPSKYNPYIKFTRKSRGRAIRFANQRKNYVLRRMFEQGWIDEEEFREAREIEIPFKRGEFRTTAVALVDLVRKQMEKKDILEALNLESIDELSSAGLQIYTTLDKDLQEAGQLSMRRNLSRLETILGGYEPEDEKKYRTLRDLRVNNFYFGKIDEIRKTKEGPELVIKFGLPVGTVPTSSLITYAKRLDMPQGRGYKFQLNKLLKKMKVGDTVFVECIEYDQENHTAVLDLHKRPKINGGLIALDDGNVRAVISGFDTIGFNRAISAKRPPGSVFKAVVYFAALQLGWSMLDRLDNTRQMFSYQGKFYYPRPDHASPYKEASMIWSGIMSENIASVALGARLLEKLNFEQFKLLLETMGLAPTSGEVPRDYHYRVARAVGVQLDNAGIEEYQLINAIKDIEPDLIFSGDYKLLEHLRRLWWGRGDLAELQAVLESELDENPSRLAREAGVRLGLVRNNYLRLKNIAANLRSDWSDLTDSIERIGVERAFVDPETRTILERFRVLPGERAKPELGYSSPSRVSEAVLVNSVAYKAGYRPQRPGRPLNILDMRAIWGDSGLLGGGGSAGISLADVKVDYIFPLSVFVLLQRNVESRITEVHSSESTYDLLKYFNHHDFRIGVGLLYLVNLAKAMGVESPLEPVLSFPLGTNDVSAAEVAKVYQTFIDGKVRRFYKDGTENQINFITRINDRFGNLLYEAEVKERQFVKPEYAVQMREILRKVVTHGTGRRINHYLKISLESEEESNKKLLSNIRMPGYGKTGTTNDFTTSYFAGFLPFPVEQGKDLSPLDSYSIAAYVGYDLNKVMRNGAVRVYGSVGAMPLWGDFAGALIETKEFNKYVDRLDIGILSQKQWPLLPDPLARKVRVDLPRGLLVSAAREDSELDYGVADEILENQFAPGVSVNAVLNVPSVQSNVGWQPLRMFAPFIAESTLEAVEEPISSQGTGTGNSRLGQDSESMGSGLGFGQDRERSSDVDEPDQDSRVKDLDSESSQEKDDPGIIEEELW